MSDDRTNAEEPREPNEHAEHTAATDSHHESESVRERITGWRMNRRKLLATGAATGVASATAALGGTLAKQTDPNATPPSSPDEAATAAANTGDNSGDMEGMDMAPAAPTNTGYSFFVPYQAAIIEAAAARLIPTDDLGPGATEAGVASFIDRQLSSQKSYRGPRYMSGPFVPGETTQGDQSGMSLRDRFRIGIFGLDHYAQQKFGSGFVQLSTDQQDAVLTDLDGGVVADLGVSSVIGAPTAVPDPAAEQPSGQASLSGKSFFDLLLSFTQAGYFADPVQGGNRDMVGWKLIGFPGAHVSWADQILNYGQPFQGDYISLGQYQQQISGGD